MTKSRFGKNVFLAFPVFLLLSLACQSLSWAAILPKGDLNGDGKVDVRDSLAIMQMLAGLREPDPVLWNLADVAPLPAGDGKLTLADLIVSLRASVDNNSFQACQATVLSIAKKYYEACSDKIEPDLAGDFLRITALTPKTFDGSHQDPQKAVALANMAAGASLASGSRFFTAALASVAFAQCVFR